MARARLVKDRRLAVAPGTRRVVAFDSDTGAGSECCCGGVGACCATTGNTECTVPFPDSERIKCGRRVDLQLSGSLERRIVTRPWGAPEYTSYQQSATANLSVFWRLKDNTGDDPACLEVIGKSPASARSGSGTRTEFGETTTWSLSKNDTTFLTGLPTLSRGWSRSIQQGGPGDPWSGFYAACGWSAFGLDHGINTGLSAPGAAVVMFDPAPVRVSGGEESVGFDATVALGLAEAYFPGSVTGRECSGSGHVVKNAGFPYEREAFLSWSSTAGQSGGSFSLALSVRTNLFPTQSAPVTVETVEMSGTWVLGRTLCDGDTDTPDQFECSAFIAAWLAGDAAADVNGDGFVSGDDFDLVLAQHPECFAQISGLTMARVNQIRSFKRAARAGAVTAGNLLGV